MYCVLPYHSAVSYRWSPIIIIIIITDNSYHSLLPSLPADLEVQLLRQKEPRIITTASIICILAGEL